MSFLTIRHVALRGFAAAVPSRVEENVDLPFFAEGEAEKVIKSTGIERRHVVEPGTTTADLSLPAALRLLDELGWAPESIDALIFASSSRDYITPSTSCILQDRLGLSESIYTTDIPYGCTGWVHGMSVISALLATGEMKRGLLMAGDTSTQMNYPDDKESRPLFGDAATVTALEYSSECEPLLFNFGTEGKNYQAIITRDGGMRHPFSESSLVPVEYGRGIKRRNIDCKIDGMEVFAFSSFRGEQCVREFYSHFGVAEEEIDYFLFHQANRYMIERIRKKLKVDPAKVPYSLSDYGNTSCASIPLTLLVKHPEDYRNRPLKTLACAFGVGLCWGAVHFTTNGLCCSDLILYDPEKRS
ncbi:MAG: 3-oxoacyl-ACP synthase III family protein [Thermoguttaceae bacterium]|jgi:3-oxoacyl-[acyl-carrier-protein] synthase-3